WPTSTVGDILTNETYYTGVTYYNKHRWVGSDRTDMTFRKTRKTRAYMRPREEWIAIQVPAIIDQETFVRVQQQLKKSISFWSAKKTSLEEESPRWRGTSSGRP
ncbi:MAG: recombinase family protein, partial [Thermoanaerobaculales bacterium]|nr:recombinase family protein [Thermoanaerobaculales bacterium]